MYGEASPPADIAGLTGLERFDLSGRGYIYFLALQGVVVYVGQTVSLPNRIAAHAKGKLFDEVWYVRCPVGDLDRVEQEWIDRLCPPLNRKGNPNRASSTVVELDIDDTLVLIDHAAGAQCPRYGDYLLRQQQLALAGLLTHRETEKVFGITKRGRATLAWAGVRYGGLVDAATPTARRRILRRLRHEAAASESEAAHA